ncbi:MAG: tyrosine-type recombinase/integrase [Terrimicrobiaceae bacterium]
MTTTSKGYGDYVVFVESKALRGRSKQEYLRQVRKLGEHYAGRELAGVTEREVFDYLVHRREVEKLRPSTLNQAVVALRMFYRDYLGRRWALWERFEIRRDHPLPVVLTRKETRRLLGSVRSGRFRAVLALIYHCGLRVGEAVGLKPGHIDAQRGVVRIVEGKGGRMREVPISCAMVERLRRYWSFHRNKRWLFAGVGRGWKDRTRSLSQAMPHGASWRPPASLRRVPAASFRLSQLQSPGVSALRGTRAGRVDAQARGAAPARAVLSADCDRAGGDAQCVPAFSSRVVSGVLRCRSAFTEGRRLGYDQTGRIVLSYRDSADGRLKSEALDPLELIRRWLLHVLPKGLVRVRHYGWLSPAAHKAS